MFFRRKAATLDTLDARLTALEMLFEARQVDAARPEGLRPVSDPIARALDSFTREWKADRERRGVSD